MSTETPTDLTSQEAIEASMAPRTTGDAEQRIHVNLMRVSIALIILATVIGFVVRLWHLDHEPMHVDEIKQAQEVQAPWSELVGLSYRHQQPPLDYFLGKAATVVGGTSDASQRAPSLIAGVAIVGLVGWLLARRGYPVAAAAVSLLAAVHPFLVAYSQYARPYSLPIAMVLMVLVLHQETEIRGRSRFTSSLFVVLAALALLSRALMPAIALGTFFLVRARRVFVYVPATRWARIRSDPLALVGLPMTFLFVWIPSFLALRHYSNHLEMSNYDFFGRVATAVDRFGVYGASAVHPWSLLYTLALVVLVLIAKRSRRALASSASVWLPIAATGPLFALAHSLTTYEGLFFADRYEVFLPLGLAMTIGVGADAGLQLSQRLSNLSERRTWAIGSLAAAALAIAFVSASSHMVEESRIQRTADWGSVGRYIEDIERPGDAIFTIDTRPFERAFRFGFMSEPRYYTGASVISTPASVIGGEHEALLLSNRVHIVLFVPRVSSDEDLPEGWTIVHYTQMVVATSPQLGSTSERIADLEAFLAWLRPDVAVQAQIAVAVAAQGADLLDASERIAETALTQASAMGQLEYAQQLLEYGGALP